MTAWTLCSKDDVISLHPVTETEIKDEWSEMVEDLIREHMGQPFLGYSGTVLDEYHDGDGTNVLRVKKPPIISVTSLSVNDVSLSASDYVAFENYIELRAQVFPRGALNTKLTYLSGDTTPSNVVRMTAAAMIVAIINYRKRAGADASIKWGTAERKDGEKTPNQYLGLTSHLVKIMKQMLKRPFVRVW